MTAWEPIDGERKPSPRIETAIVRLHRLRHLARYSLGKEPVLIPPNATSELDQLETRVLWAIRRDETGDLTPDGHRTGRPGNGGEDAAQSTTEAAALQRVNPTIGRDRHRQFTRAVEDAIQRINVHLDRLVDLLDAIDAASTASRHSNPPSECGACRRRVMNVGQVKDTPSDLIKGGWCNECRHAWVEYTARSLQDGRIPDRASFARTRRPSR